MADRAEQDRVVTLKLFLGVGREGFAGREVVFPAPVVIFLLGGEAEFRRGGVEHLDRLGDHFRTGAVARQHRDLVILCHGISPIVLFRFLQLCGR